MNLLADAKFYVLIGFYSIYYLILHFFGSIFKNSGSPIEGKHVAVPPKCLSNEDGHHHWVKLGHSKYHYVERGNRNNRLLLLIHGFPEFWYSWRFQLRNLSTYYWVIAIDMKGFGDSDKPRNRNEYDVKVLVTELKDFLTAVGRTRCSLVTHGMGGLVGWHFVQNYPTCVDAYVSISSPHPKSFLQELSLGRVSNQGFYYFSPLSHYPEIRAMRSDLAIFNKLYSKMISSKRGNMTSQDIEAFKYSFSRMDDWIGPVNYFRTLLLHQPRQRRKIAKSTIPTLFIVGNSDPYVTLESICKSTEWVDNFTLKIVEGGGHFLPQEMPNYVNSLILDFLKVPEPPFESNDDWADGSIFKKVIGAGRTVWSTSKDAMARGYSIPKKLASNHPVLTLD